MKHDWTKLDNGWERHPLASCIIKQLSRVQAVMVYDDGGITTDSAIDHNETLRLLTEAIEQRKKCEVHKEQSHTDPAEELIALRQHMRMLANDWRARARRLWNENDQSGFMEVYDVCASELRHHLLLPGAVVVDYQHARSKRPTEGEE